MMSILFTTVVTRYSISYLVTPCPNAIKVKTFYLPLWKGSTTPPFEKGGLGGILLGADLNPP
jgi:hypothetical protein